MPVCPVELTVSMLSGKWRIVIFKELSWGPLRYGRLRQALPGISPKVLTGLLREMEDEGLVRREVFPEVPPRVEYSLSAKGLSLFVIFKELRGWGLEAGSDGKAECRFCKRCRPYIKHDEVRSVI